MILVFRPLSLQLCFQDLLASSETPPAMRSLAVAVAPRRCRRRLASLAVSVLPLLILLPHVPVSSGLPASNAAEGGHLREEDANWQRFLPLEEDDEGSDFGVGDDGDALRPPASTGAAAVGAVHKRGHGEQSYVRYG